MALNSALLTRWPVWQVFSKCVAVTFSPVCVVVRRMNPNSTTSVLKYESRPRRRNLAEQPMLDGVPLGRPRRIVAHRDLQPAFVREVLQPLLSTTALRFRVLSLAAKQAVVNSLAFPLSIQYERTASVANLGYIRDSVLEWCRHKHLRRNAFGDIAL